MIGQTLSHYRIVEKIGAGGMGVVYRARDERLERDVALKVLPSGTLADETARKRFRKEALALSQLNHPNIATVHDFDTHLQFHHSAYNVASLYALAGKPAPAVEWLRKTAAIGMPNHPLLTKDRHLDRIRSDPAQWEGFRREFP